ncbi:Cof-type HAD-IIB family hydrolase [Alkalicoccobacillus murimartini]|uniref:Cof subfamily protein (Haloacid dehalogenase superfamily) n=1 Tax=Alkalicoccobacillus murimartini TaxID=171685 RepID=A0ABT9YJJ5_9BACI|nr:Cof-type HAD-IIB family hydrolase [Alkalicoccobacillus murimartini]MDQ0207387.1 Cof subfamily protein (haloacid dehalogenase superfamily) [Alkalicoccobacillus murimartini]
MYKQLLVSDLDGTLLNEHHQISVENKKAIQAFTEKGGLFTIATGRMLSAALPYIQELDLKVPVILGNGTQIYCPKQQRLLQSHTITSHRNKIDQIWNTHSDRGVVLAYINDQIYTPNRNGLISTYEDKENVTCIVSDTVPLQMNKLLVIGEQIHDAVQMVGELLKVCIQSDTTYLELLPFGVSKGSALQELRRLLGHDIQRIISVGDQLNDLSLFEASDCGYAVENAHTDLKRVASYITKHHRDHAIAAVISEDTALI